MLLEIVIIFIYSIALILIFMYALAQLNLLFNYLGAQKNTKNSPEFDFSNTKFNLGYRFRFINKSNYNIYVNTLLCLY